MPAGALVLVSVLLAATLVASVVVVRARLVARVWRSEAPRHADAGTWWGGCQVREESGDHPGLGRGWLVGSAVITHGRIHLTSHRWGLRSRERPTVVIDVAVLDRPLGHRSTGRGVVTSDLPAEWSGW